MYNGIGLATVRGSGTNGYVQKNLSFVSQTRTAERKDHTGGQLSRDIPQPKKADADIIEHNRKRDVEVKVFRLREALEEQGVDEAEIESKTSEMRKNLLAQLPPSKRTEKKGANEPADPRGKQETHAMAAQKEEETRALKQALGISSEYKAGQAFDRELQAKRREERLAQKAAEEAKITELEALLEKEKRREAKQQEKERKRAEKEEKKRKKREAAGKPPKASKRDKDGGREEAREEEKRAPPPPPPPRERDEDRRGGRGDDDDDRGTKRRRDEREDDRERDERGERYGGRDDRGGRDEPRRRSPPRRSPPRRSRSSDSNSYSRSPAPRRGRRSDSRSDSRSPRRR